MSAAEERWKEPASLIPPPLKFKDSPEEEENINSNTDHQNISSYLLTPPSEFCDSSSSADYPKSHHESDLNETIESKSGDGNDVSVSSEKPSAMFNKRLTYCINKKSEDSGVSDSSSETSLIEENDSLADGNACRAKSSIAVVDTCTTKESNENVSCIPGKGSRFQDEVSDIFADNEPSLYNAAVRNRLPVVNKRRTYIIPKISNIPEKIEENLSQTSEEEDNSDSKNERRINSRTCRSEKITEGSIRDYCSEESTFDGKNKRRTFVIQQDPGKPTVAKKESDCNDISHESNESNDDMDNTINKKALFIDIIKNDVSFIDRGVFPRGRELSRTPPSTNSSFDFNHHIGISNNIGTPTSVRSVNKFITIPESKTVPNVNCAETHELEKCNQDATFTVKSGDSSYIFDDSLALFPCKKRLNGKIANDNHLDEEKSAVNREEEADEDVRQNKVGRKTTRSRVAQVGSILVSENSDSNILASEKTKKAKKTRNIVSKTFDVLSDIEQTVAKGVEAHIDHNEKHEQKEVSEGNQDVEDIGSGVSPIVERAIIDDLEKKGKSRNTRTARKGRKENIELINEEGTVIKSQLKSLDSDKCQPKLSQRKTQAKETKSVLKTDIEDAKPITKKRVIKPRTKNVKNENLKEFEIGVNAADNVKNKEHGRLNLQVLEENESDVNENEETFLKPNSDTLKKLTEHKRRMRKNDSSNGGQETELENIISSRPVRRNRTQKTHDEETENVEKQNIIASNHMEDGNGLSFPSASEIKNGPKTRTSRNKIKDEVSSHEKESEENETLFNKHSNIEKTIQNERPGRKIRSSRVAMMVEKFEKTENDLKELKSKINIRRGRNSKIEIDKQIDENDEFKIGDEKDIKSSRKINSTKITESEDNKENYVMDEIKNEKKDEIKSKTKAKTKGRQKKMSEEEEKENQNNDKDDSENDQIIKSKSKPKQKKNKEETENGKPKIAKKPLIENNENKSSVLENENEYRRPSRKCKSYAKLAITDMLSSPSE